MAAVFEKKKKRKRKVKRKKSSWNRLAVWLCGVVRSCLPFYSPFMKGSCQPISCPAGQTSWTASLETEKAEGRDGAAIQSVGIVPFHNKSTGADVPKGGAAQISAQSKPIPRVAGHSGVDLPPLLSKFAVRNCRLRVNIVGYTVT